MSCLKSYRLAIVYCYLKCTYIKAYYELKLAYLINVSGTSGLCVMSHPGCSFPLFG